MTHTYSISGITCDKCVQKISGALQSLDNIEQVTISKNDGTANVTMKNHVPLRDLQSALTPFNGKYQLSEVNAQITATENDSFFSTYKPIIFLFIYITAVAGICAAWQRHADMQVFMRVFMAGFFLSFSFFKMLDLKGFAESYAGYDLIARRFSWWGYCYAFIEAGLGLAYAADLSPRPLNLITLLVMTLSLAGVLKSLLAKRQITCACLGTVFKLPMTSVTVIEDGLMIVMSVIMLFMLS